MSDGEYNNSNTRSFLKAKLCTLVTIMQEGEIRSSRSPSKGARRSTHERPFAIPTSSKFETDSRLDLPPSQTQKRKALRVLPPPSPPPTFLFRVSLARTPITCCNSLSQPQCRRLVPHSRVVSDALGRLTLLPCGRARRVVESMLPLADACPTQASALINLCRKCTVQGENKVGLFARAMVFLAHLRWWSTRNPCGSLATRQPQLCCYRCTRTRQ